MTSRFNLQKEDLSNYIQNAIICIEALQDLKFERAEDWTMKGQGYSLIFKGKLYKNENQNYDQTIANINMQFCHNPMTKLPENDESDFEELDCSGNDTWIVYLKQSAKYFK